MSSSSVMVCTNSIMSAWVILGVWEDVGQPKGELCEAMRSKLRELLKSDSTNEGGFGFCVENLAWFGFVVRHEKLAPSPSGGDCPEFSITPSSTWPRRLVGESKSDLETFQRQPAF